MKSICIVIVLSALALTFVEPIWNKRPRPLMCRRNEYHRIPHETSCKLYYVCSHGMKTLYRCPWNLLFNRRISLCDQPENVRCNYDFNDSDSIETDEVLIEIPAGCIGTCPIRDPKNYTVLLPHDDCKKFCMCSNGMGYVYDCPAGLNFDSVHKVCDSPASAVCGKRPSYQNAFVIETKNYEENDLLGTLNEEIDDARDTHDNF